MRLRKRNLIVVCLLTLLVFLSAAGIFWLAGIATGAENVYEVAVAEAPDANSKEILLSGIDISDVPSGNLLRNASFEPFFTRTSMTIESTDEKGIYVNQESRPDELQDVGVLDGAAISIVGQTDSAQELRLTSTVQNYSLNHIAGGRALQLPSEAAATTFRLHDVGVRMDEQGGIASAVVCGADGLLWAEVQTGTPKVIKLPGRSADPVAVADAGDIYYVLTADGGLFSSANGSDWQILSERAEPDEAAPASDQAEVFRDIEWFADRLFIGGSSLYSATAGSLPVRTEFVPDGTVLSFCKTSDVLYLLTGQGVWQTTDGVRWSRTVLPLVPQQLSASRNGRLVLAAAADGRVAVSRNGGPFELQASALPEAPQTLAFSEFAEDRLPTLIPVSQTTWLLLARSGQLYLSTDSGVNWQPSYPHPLTACFMLKPGLFLLTESAGLPSLHSFQARLELTETANLANCLPGDVCMIEKQLPTEIGQTIDNQIESPWLSTGTVTSEADGNGAPRSGLGYLKMNANEGTATISQRLPDNSMSNLSSGKICLLNVHLKGDEVAIQSESSPEFILRGPFGEIRNVSESLNADWNRRAMTFFLPGLSDSLYPLYLDIRWSGPGTVYLDNLYLGEDRDPKQIGSSTFFEKITKTRPSVVRLSVLSLGTSSSGADSWLLPGDSGYQLVQSGHRGQTPTVNLEDAMRLTGVLGGDPWVVISPYMTETELLNLCEYLSGPVSSTYGKKRVEAGTAVPWAHQFDRFIFEFADPEAIFPNDAGRSGFIDRMMRVVETSPYYDQLKQRLIFIDGMYYADDVVLSRADFHASDFSPELFENRADPASYVRQEVNRFITSAPRKILADGEGYGEMIRSFKLHPVTAASSEVGIAEGTAPELATATALGNQVLGHSVRGILINADGRESTLALAAITGDLSGYQPLNVIGTDAHEEKAGPVYTFAYQKGKNYKIIVVNLTEEAVSCRVNLTGRFSSKRFVSYDATGHEYPLFEHRHDRPFQLLSGNIAVLELEKR